MHTQHSNLSFKQINEIYIHANADIAGEKMRSEDPTGGLFIRRVCLTHLADFVNIKVRVEHLI